LELFSILDSEEERRGDHWEIKINNKKRDETVVAEDGLMEKEEFGFLL